MELKKEPCNVSEGTMVTYSTSQKLREHAHETGMRPSEVIRTAIEFYLERHGKKETFGLKKEEYRIGELKVGADVYNRLTEDEREYVESCEGYDAQHHALASFLLNKN